MEASISLLLGALAFCMLSMDLALSIVYRKLAPKKGVTALVVFTATSLALVFFMMLDNWSALSFSSTISDVLGYIWTGLVLVDICFLLSFVPFFTCWIIGHPWRNPYRTIFFIASLAYLVLGLWNIISPDRLVDALGFAICFLDLFFCVVVMIKNRKGIADRDIRALLLVTFIIAFSLLPFIVASLFVPFVRGIGVQTLFLAYSIEILVFLFLGTARAIKNREGSESGEEDKVDLSVYHITERESEVIGLVGQGLTNKEIAARLGLSVNTVNNHIANIFSKTGVRSRIDLLNLIHKGVWK